MTVAVATTTRIRTYHFPYAREIFDSRIERVVEVAGARRNAEIHVELRALRPLGPGRLEWDERGPCEVLDAELVPLRLRFTHAAWVKRTGVYAALEGLAEDHPARRLFDVLHIRPPDEGLGYWFLTDVNEPGHDLAVRAAGCALEERSGAVERVTVRRRWALRPAAPASLVVRPKQVHGRYGGDPVAIRLGGRVHRQRLFIGGLHHQGAQRPQVDRVLNLCEGENPWLASCGAHPADRHAEKGELDVGMAPDDLLAEARWVVEALRAGERVLVHCYGGVNRSATVCCAALMLLEGLGAEAALARVRERHPEANPDPYHWLRLLWLERLRGAGPEPASHGAAAVGAAGGRLLRGAGDVG
jgi:hypothetical protein